MAPKICAVRLHLNTNPDHGQYTIQVEYKECVYVIGVSKLPEFISCKVSDWSNDVNFLLDPHHDLTSPAPGSDEPYTGVDQAASAYVHAIVCFCNGADYQPLWTGLNAAYLKWAQQCLKESNATHEYHVGAPIVTLVQKMAE